MRWNSLSTGTLLCGLLAVCSSDSLRGQSLIASSSLVQLNGQVNGPAVTANLSLSSAPNPATAYTASVSNCVGGIWLTATPSSGVTPQSVLLTATPGALVAGSYSCSVNFTAASSNIGVLVIFTVSTGGGTGSFTSNPASVAFTHQIGQTAPSRWRRWSSPRCSPVASWSGWRWRWP